MGEMTVLITGATGFVGAAAVRAARNAGHRVIALGRDAGKGAVFSGDDGIAFHALDLSAPEAQAALAPLLEKSDAVIHAAAAMAGDDAAHAAQTLAPTRAVLDAMQAAKAAKTPARLVLVSSFAVYGYGALPDGACLDETTPIEPDPARRDAYARAKLAQEQMVIEAAQHSGIEAQILRPGAIYGASDGAARVWTARLGVAKAGRVFCIGGDAPVPAVHVDHVGAALVAAATLPMEAPDDYPVIRGGGRVALMNIVDPDAPTQSAWLEAIGKKPIRIPRGIVMKLAKGLGLIGDLWPAFGRHLPVGLGEAALAARYKPLRYSLARAEDRLNYTPAQGFSAAIAAAQEKATT